MDVKTVLSIYNRFKFGEDRFYELMQKRIRNILLVSGFYDAYILEQDGRIADLVFGEYRQLNLSTAPKITTIASYDEVIPILQKESFDLVVVSMRVSSQKPYELGKQIKSHFPNLPTLLLLNKNSYIEVIQNHCPKKQCFDDIFLWNGNAKVFVAMIKSIEDKLNINKDTSNASVGVLLLVENAVKYYSLLLPILYHQIFSNTQQLVDSELNENNKRMRMRARPKVILIHSYDDAIYYYQKYKDYIIGIITNSNLEMNGKFDINAGVKFVEMIRRKNQYLPILMESSDKYNKFLMKNLNADFIDKFSKNLISEINKFLAQNLGYGQFTFCNIVGERICAVQSIQQFIEVVSDIDTPSLLQHLSKKHFSAWLSAKGEFDAAKEMQKIECSTDVKDIRNRILTIVKDIRKKQNRGKLIRFSEEQIYDGERIIRLAEGSLGGKGRGIAFMNALLASMEHETNDLNIELKLPRTAIIGTNEYDHFIQSNDILNKVKDATSDHDISSIFISGKLSQQLREKVLFLINFSTFPLAIRSSGLLEDSQSQPFAGVYQTFMIPNKESPEVVLEAVCNAIKLVFSSPFLKDARDYIESTCYYKLEEEKMAVIIQEVVGNEYLPDKFFPHLSGVIQSHNYYPSAFFDPDEGIASIAAGLGKTVVEGQTTYRYCPLKPKIDPISSKQIVEENQRYFYAIDLTKDTANLNLGETSTLSRVRITQKMKESCFKIITSGWDYENFEFIDSSYYKGPRVLTYRRLLKYQDFDFNKVIELIMQIGKISMGVPVEIEFAVKFDDTRPIFYLLQIRPMTVNEKTMHLEFDKYHERNVILQSNKSMGNGVFSDINHIVFYHHNKFLTTETFEMKHELEQINNDFKQKNLNYILIGPGRWGSSDRFLGIPVKWSQISKAKIIVELSDEKSIIETSQGSHFFHNIVAMNIGYLTVNLGQDQVIYNKNILMDHPQISKHQYFSIAKFKAPLIVHLDGRQRKAIISL
jgi:hypothetical protein